MRRSEARCGLGKPAQKALALGVSAVLVAQARGLGLPRCDGIQSTPVMEVAPPGDDGWRGYMLRSEAKDCVYESMSDERIDDCMQGKWLMMVGSSNAVIQMFRMLQLFLGNEEMELYFGPEDSRTEDEWKELFYSPKNTMSVQFDFSNPEREVKCWDLEEDRPNCLAIGSNSTTTGYFSGTLQYLMPGLIDKLKAIRAVMSPDLPPPILVFSVDTWLHECVKSMTNKKHWAYWTCSEIFKGMEQVTEDAWLALNVQFYHEFLAYLRDEWPEIKEFYQEAYSYMYLVEPYFSEAVLRENGYPKVIWYRNRIDTTLVEENFIQKGHRHGPLSVAANEWLLDEVCRANREQFKVYRTPYRKYAPTCVASRKSHFAALFSCPSKVSGDVKLDDILSDSGLPPLNVSVSSSVSTINDARGNFEFQDLYSPFHIWVTIMSSITLLFGTIVEFAPTLFSNLEGYLNYVRGGNSVKSSPSRASSTDCPTNCSLHHSGSEGTHPSQSSYSHLFPEEPSEEDQTLLKTRALTLRSVPSPKRDHSSSESSSHSDVELVASQAQRSNKLVSEGRGTKSDLSIEARDELCLKDVEAPVYERMAAPSASKEISEAQQRESVTTKPPTRAPKLLALGMARYIASVHIVIGHMMQGFSRPGDARAFPIGTFPTNGWGFSWVPFFMMLSGFVLTYARLFSSQPDKYMPWTTFTVQRIRGIYPLFLAGLFARAGQLAVLNETSFSLGSPFETISLLLLLQSWFPAVVVQGLQAHCWFLSCIVPYWALHQAMYRKIKEWTTRSLWAFVVGVTVVPFALLVLIPPALGVSVTWYSSWDGYTMNTNLHYAVAILKFHPVCYLHIYVFGMVAAVLVHRTEEHHRVIQSAFRQGGLIGFVALYAIFGISHYAVPPAYKLTCRLGLLAPIQGLYLIGLAKQEDPLSRFFSLGVFAPLENLSFPQYIFQFIAFFGWQSWMSIGFWLWLSALSLLGYYFVQSPLRSKSKPVKVQALGVANIFVLAGFVTLLAFLFRYEILEQSFPKGMLPAVVEFPDGSVDVRIESSRALGLTINPSLLWLPEQDKMILAVRSHKYVRVVEGGYEDQIWYSDLYVDEVDTLTLQPMGRLENIMSSNAAWVSCPDLPYTYVPINRTYTRTRVTGPEDPRLMLSKDGKVILTANLKDPAAAADGASAECSLNRRMLAGELDIDAMELAAQMSLMNSIEPSADTEEKNWLLFEHDGALKFVQSISPFTVVRVDKPLSGEASDVNVVVESSVFHSAISDLFALGLSVHGGANPILVSGNETNLRYVTTQGGESADTFLGIFHTKSVDGEYMNFFFQFKLMEDTQDWRIVRVSKRIRVLESNFSVDSGVTAPMTFVSGLTGNEEHVFVSYGSSNAEARVIKMSWGVLNAYFA